jgi:hypothetical protein
MTRRLASLAILLVSLAALTSAQTVVTRGGVIKSKSCVGQCIHVTKFSPTEWRIVTPVVGAPQTYQVEWRLKTSNTTPVSASGPIWYIQGVYGRDLANPGDVRLSDDTDSSVYEYAWKVCIAGAPPVGCEYYGNAHAGETLSSPITFVLDGVDISTFNAGSTKDGMSLIVTQNKNALLPHNADGSLNLSTQIGTGITTHTFNTTGMKITHTHSIDAGYVGFAAVAAALPGSVVNFNRVNLNGGAPYTPIQDDSVQFIGTQITEASFWHTSAHRFKMTMTLPSGGPAVPSDWSYAGPDYGVLLDEVSRPKVLVYFITGSYASRIPLSPLGTVTQEQQYFVSYQ